MSEPKPQAEQPAAVPDQAAARSEQTPGPDQSPGPESLAAGEPTSADQPTSTNESGAGETPDSEAGDGEAGDGEADSGAADGGAHGDGEDAGPGKVRRSRRLRFVLGSVLAVGVAGAAVAGTIGFPIVAQKDATLDPPDQVGTLRRDNGAEAQSTAEYLRDALSAEVDLDKAVGAVYTDTARTDRNVLFFGGTNLLWKPEHDLDTAFALITDNAGAVTGLHDVPAGDLGGTMVCGSTASSDGDIAVCGWADHGSVALAMFPSWTPADAAPVFLAIRNATQSRS